MTKRREIEVVIVVDKGDGGRSYLRRVLELGGELASLSATEAMNRLVAVVQLADVKTELPRCSFCAKSAKEVSKLIAGPTVYICDECIALSNGIVEDADRAAVQLHGVGQVSGPPEDAPSLNIDVQVSWDGSPEAPLRRAVVMLDPEQLRALPLSEIAERTCELAVAAAAFDESAARESTAELRALFVRGPA